MKKTFTAQERDAFAKAVSAVEGLAFSASDDRFFRSITDVNNDPQNGIKRVIARALLKS
ncbi:MAG: hypothetical protein HC777_01545 [Hyphomonadaceae bacterium]|nr:hypothetical protein [Hyphomonadaceae bacterium]